MNVNHPRAPQVSQRAALAVLYITTVAVFSDMYIAQPILPLLSGEFMVAPATAGLSISAVVLAIALASGAYGPLSDALGRKPVMVWSCVLLALPTLLCALAPSFGVLLLFRALQGLLIPGVSAVAVAYLGDLYERGQLGATVGGLIGASVMGGLLGRVAGGLIADLLHWRASFAAFGVLTLLCGLGLAYALPARPPGHSPGLAHAYRGMFAHLGDRRLVGAFLIGALLFFGFIGTFTYLPYYLSAPPFRLSTALVSSVYVVYLAGVIVSPLAGRLSQHMARRTLMALGLAIAGAGILGTLVVSLPLVIASLVLLCTGMFITQSVAPAFVNINAARAKGGASALYQAFYYIGGSAGSLLPGFAWQAWGWAGVVATCVSSLSLALLADWLLCRGELRDGDPAAPTVAS